ncbi:MAG: CRTAC1 family protein, partial [Verrucomicrobia bacterium]|nr:CRTAC1 family protein [Verrucomicrobiota bacterium]
MTNQIYHNGSGVAAGDVDGDGLCDLYFGRLEGGNALYRNQGDWRFEDATAAAGVACPDLHTTGVGFADIDGDGDLDLLVNALGRGTSCFTNDGKGHFTEVTAASEFERSRGSTSFALADIDGDGDLDLYVANYRNHSLGDEPDTRFKLKTVDRRLIITSVDGRPVTEPELVGRFSVDPAAGVLEHGQPDVLYRNDGHGRFTPVPWTDGCFLDEDGKPVAVPYDWGLSVMFRDLNGDRAPDIYVCNDLHSPDRIWINSGDGRFRALPRLALRHTSRFSMGVDVADLNRDGHDEIFVLDMLSRSHQRRLVQVGLRISTELSNGQIDNRPQYMRNTLFLNRGDGTYAEIAQAAGLQASEWSWTPVFLDVDLDGFEDLLVCNGHLRDAQNLDVTRRIAAIKAGQKLSRLEKLKLEQMFPRLETPNCAFRNSGNLTFEEVGAEWGFDLTGISQGMALADLDNDGDLDVVLNNLNAPAALLRNDSPAPRVVVRLRGVPPNTRGIGARIKVTGGPVPQSQEMICGGRYLSCDDTLRVFAAGALTNRLTIEVVWRSGQTSTVRDAQANHIYELDEAQATEMDHAARSTQHAAAEPFFADVSALLQHTHYEAEFDDAEQQPLLPRALSRLGPGVAWCDLNEDGWDDLVIGSGRGGRLRVWLNNGRGGFGVLVVPAWSGAAGDDQTGV